MDFNKNNIKKLILVIFACILFYVGIININDVVGAIGKIINLFFPFILGCGIAFVINVPMSRIEYWLFHKTNKLGKARRPISFVLTLVAVIGIITIAIYIIVPQIADTLQAIAKQLPGAITALQDWAISKASYWEFLGNQIDRLALDWETIATKSAKIMQSAATALVNSGIGAVANILSTLLNFFIGFIFAIYILMAKENLARQGKQVIWALFNAKTAEKILYVCNLSYKTFAKFISGQCLEACILGMMFFVSMSIGRLPYAMLISVLIAFTALIPMVGAFIGCVVGALLIMMVSPMKAFAFVILFLILQQVEGNLVYPHVVGNSVGLPSMWVLFAITIGANVMGVAGMIIFIPLFSVLYAIFRLFIKDKLKRKSIPAYLYQNHVEIPDSVMVDEEDMKL